MRLVDNEQRNASGGDQFVKKLAIFEPLRCDVKQLRGVAVDVRRRIVRGGSREGGVDLVDMDAGPGGFVLLVLHKSDKRADDQHGTRQKQSRKLVGQRLSRPGRQQAKHVAVAEDRFQDFALAGPQLLDAEAAARLVQNVGPGNISGGGGCDGLVRNGVTLGGGTAHAIVNS